MRFGNIQNGWNQDALFAFVREFFDPVAAARQRSIGLDVEPLVAGANAAISRTLSSEKAGRLALAVSYRLKLSEKTSSPRSDVGLSGHTLAAQVVEAGPDFYGDTVAE